MNPEVCKCTTSVKIIDPLTGKNASKSSFKLIEIQKTFFNAFLFLQIKKTLYETKKEEESNIIKGLVNC